MNIRLIATDLDGTLLNKNYGLSDANAEALEKAAEKGVVTVIATGRSFLSIPEEVKQIKGLEYAVTANGAKVNKLPSGELVYGKYIDDVAIDKVWDTLTKPNIMLEVFFEGIPYVDNLDYIEPKILGVTDNYLNYFRSSRKPVGSIYEFINEHKNQIENINLVFRDPYTREDTFDQLRGAPEYSLTSSFPFNLEIGGVNVNKADAIEYISKKNNIDQSQTLCIGDNINDAEMISYAGIGIAMADAVDEVKKIADDITKGHDDSGVAHAINKYVLSK